MTTTNLPRFNQETVTFSANESVLKTINLSPIVDANETFVITVRNTSTQTPIVVFVGNYEPLYSSDVTPRDVINVSNSSSADNTFTVNNHGLAIDDAVVCSETSGLTGLLNAEQPFYITSVPTPNTFTVSSIRRGTALSLTDGYKGSLTIAPEFSLITSFTVPQSSTDTIYHPAQGIVSEVISGYNLAANRVVIAKQMSATLPFSVTVQIRKT